MTKHAAPSSFPMIPSIIWLTAFCLAGFLFVRKLTPIYTQETLASAYPITTPLLLPGDTVAQNFTSTQDQLHAADIALYYDESLSDAAAVRVSLLRGSEIVMEQELNVRSCPNGSFLTFRTDAANCAGETFTLKVDNVSVPSAAPESTSFSLMATDKQYLYLDNTDDYRFNHAAQNARILCRFTYRTGYSYYRALTYAFWVFLAALIATKRLPKFPASPSGKQPCP